MDLTQASSRNRKKRNDLLLELGWLILSVAQASWLYLVALGFSLVKAPYVNGEDSTMTILLILILTILVYKITRILRGVEKDKSWHEGFIAGRKWRRK